MCDLRPFFRWVVSKWVLLWQCKNCERVVDLSKPSEPVRHADCGSAEWLRSHALFVCDHCVEYGDGESACMRASELRMVDGMTICDGCWADYPGEVTDVWAELNEFDPFQCLNK